MTTPAAEPPTARAPVPSLFTVDSTHPSGTLATGSAHEGEIVGGRYEIVSLAGNGGMGAVWKAHDQLLDRSVALKEVVDPGDSGYQTPREHAVQEARTATDVDHPGVVTVHDMVVWSDRPWIVMELLTGPTLDEEIRRRGRIDRPMALDVASRLLEALAAVHEAGLVHRDVKPSNVVLVDEGRVVLTDFGLAGPIGDRTDFTAGRLVGSPPYLAPEALDTGRFDVATDLFSFGATLFCALEGYRPFDAGTPRATMRALRERPAPPMPHAGPAEPLVHGLLEKDPRDRLTTPRARAMLADLAA